MQVRVQYVCTVLYKYIMYVRFGEKGHSEFLNRRNDSKKKKKEKREKRKKEKGKRRKKQTSLLLPQCGVAHRWNRNIYFSIHENEYYDDNPYGGGGGWGWGRGGRGGDVCIGLNPWVFSGLMFSNI